MTPEEEKTSEHLHFELGYSGRKISKIMDLPKSTINDYLKQARPLRGEPNVPDGLKVLVFDIETAPNIAYHWGRFRVNIGQAQVIQESFLLCWCAKWLGSEDVMMDSLHYHTDEIHPEADKPLVENLWKLIDKADIIVAHNNDGFDEPTLNARALYYGKNPPHPSKSVDTLKIARNKFKFPGGNSLDAISQYLGLDEFKMDTGGFQLWRDCMNGDKEAFDKMVTYCAQDVAVLEQLYLHLRPWDNRHPNVALMGDLGGKQCGCCGSYDVERTGQFAYTGVSKFPTYRCNDCGTVRRGRSSIIEKEDREDILMNVAK